MFFQQLGRSIGTGFQGRDFRFAMSAFFRHSDVLDVNAIYSNDLNLILHQYGVEACSRAIVQAGAVDVLSIQAHGCDYFIAVAVA
ncbi:hypothetical protein COOONC_14339 [Cooperia oncophora]